MLAEVGQEKLEESSVESRKANLIFRVEGVVGRAREGEGSLDLHVISQHLHLLLLNFWFVLWLLWQGIYFSL